MKVSVKNIEPCWVEYMFEVEIPDDTPADEINDVALALTFANEGTIVRGLEILGTIEGMDQEWEVQR